MYLAKYFFLVSYTQVMQSAPISELMLNAQSDYEINQLSASMMHLTFQNMADNSHYKFHGFGRDQVRSV